MQQVSASAQAQLERRKELELWRALRAARKDAVQTTDVPVSRRPHRNEKENIIWEAVEKDSNTPAKAATPSNIVSFPFNEVYMNSLKEECKPKAATWKKQSLPRSRQTSPTKLEDHHKAHSQSGLLKDGSRSSRILATVDALLPSKQVPTAPPPSPRNQSSKDFGRMFRCPFQALHSTRLWAEALNAALMTLLPEDNESQADNEATQAVPSSSSTTPAFARAPEVQQNLIDRLDVVDTETTVGRGSQSSPSRQQTLSKEILNITQGSRTIRVVSRPIKDKGSWTAFEITVHGFKARDVFLHWAVGKHEASEWVVPFETQARTQPPALRVQNAMQTAFSPLQEDGSRHIRVEIKHTALKGFQFMLFQKPNEWTKNGEGNFTVDLAYLLSPNELSPLPQAREEEKELKEISRLSAFEEEKAHQLKEDHDDDEDSSELREKEKREELHRQHLELLERLAGLQIKAGAVKLASLNEQKLIEEELVKQFSEATSELQGLTKQQDIMDAESLKRRIKRHFIKWPAQTALDMEDHLSRAHDIYVFWFFESRDRTSMVLSDFKPKDKHLDVISEFPPDWPQWKIDSMKMREEASWRRRKSGSGRLSGASHPGQDALSPGSPDREHDVDKD